MLPSPIVDKPVVDEDPKFTTSSLELEFRFPDSVRLLFSINFPLPERNTLSAKEMESRVTVSEIFAL